MNWNQQAVLVTGAGGFIGSHLAERLVRLGARTTGLVRYNSAGSWGWLDNSPLKNDLEVVAGDVRDPDFMRSVIQKVDVIFHLAALIAIPYSYHAPLSYVQTNVAGTLNVLQAARSAGSRRVVHTSTSEVYGTARYVPIDEEHPLQGQSPYSASKIAADKMAEAFHLSFDVPVAVIRPFNTFGPRQSARAVIPTIITQALTRKEVHLGNLETTRDLNFFADTVDGFIRVAESEEAIGRVINIGSGQEISIGDLARTILRLMSREDLPLICEQQRLRPEGSEVYRLLSNNSLARRVLGWQPSVNLEEGLQITINWITEHIGRYKPESYCI